jgi:GWxTD domain-containing protein
LDFYVQIPNEELRFVHEATEYIARYEITLDVLKPDQSLAWDRVATIEVRTKDFSVTSSSKHYSLRQFTADLEPGSYEINLNLQDLETKQGTRLKRKIVVLDFPRDSLALSDIMLVSRLSTHGEKKSIVPNISGNVGQQSDVLILFLEAYTNLPADSIQTECRIFNEKKERIYTSVQTDLRTGPRTQLFLKLTPPSFAMGAYLVVVEASLTGKDAQKNVSHALSNRKFYVRTGNLPMTILEIDKAIDQMRFVAREIELDSIRAGATEEERRNRFLEFWKKRDPDPQTPRNELMEEYYQRVSYANNNFATFTDGWKSDRGMVYIRLGPPENIERHPFDNNARPYEIWYYYTQNREFVFVDDSGFGDYRLKYPTTDLWGRIKN